MSTEDKNINLLKVKDLLSNLISKTLEPKLNKLEKKNEEYFDSLKYTKTKFDEFEKNLSFLSNNFLEYSSNEININNEFYNKNKDIRDKLRKKIKLVYRLNKTFKIIYNTPLKEIPFNEKNISTKPSIQSSIKKVLTINKMFKNKKRNSSISPKKNKKIEHKRNKSNDNINELLEVEENDEKINYYKLKLMENPISIPELPKENNIEEEGLFITNYSKQFYLRNDNNYDCKLTIKLKCKLNNKKSYYKKYGIYLDDSCKIENVTVNVDRNDASGEFDKNENKINLKFKLRDEETLTVNINYIEKEVDEEYYISKCVNIPTFAENSIGFLSFTFNNNYEFISLQNNVLKQNKDNLNEFFWKGITPKEGIDDIIRITLKKCKWNYNIKKTFKVPKGVINKVNIMTPLYCKYGNINILDINLKNNQCDYLDEKYIKILETFQYNFFYENLKTKEGFLKIDVDFENYSTFSWKVPKILIDKYKPKDSEEDKKYFANLAKEILKKDKRDINEVTKIGQYIHSEIEYDIDYHGKNLTSKEILKKKKGVCEHYSQLFNSILNSIGYETLHVSGIAFKEDNGNIVGRELHGWSIVKIDGKWLPFDPTWNLLNGKVPVSHIFLCYGNILMKFSKVKTEIKLEPNEDEISHIQD